MKYPLTLNELTEFVKEVILVLKEELSDGYLTQREFRNYVRLFQFTADRVLARHSQMQDEVNRLTEPLIKLSSMIEDELWAKIEDQKTAIADQETMIAGQKTIIENQKNEIADKDAEINRLMKLVNQLNSGGNR